MCGIVGTIDSEITGDILRLISHRGPDDTGMTKAKVGKHIVNLGHTRLAIVDLSPTGHQPMSTLDDTCFIVFNGEIYNHTELKQKIEKQAFRGHSDTETTLYLLYENGIQSLAELNGIFALAFLDTRLGRLFLARDPFGIKPLYYSSKGGHFIFSSEIKPILRLVDDELDRDNLAELLRLRYSPSPDTLFRSIKKVRPGHIIEINLLEAKIQPREYPYIHSVTSDGNSIPFPEAVEEYGNLFDLAVRRQLMSDVEVGLLLSGGIDSALVAAFAQRHSGYQMKAFTVGYKEVSEADEILPARSTARCLGLDHHDVRIDFEDFLESIAKCVAIVEEPLATTSIIPMFHLAALASRYVKVVISGQGADELLGGYRRYQGELYRQFVPLKALRYLNPLVLRLGLRSDGILRGLNALSEPNDVDRFVSVYQVFSDREIERLVGRRDVKARERVQYFFDLLKCSEQSTTAERMMCLDLRMNLSDDLLLYTDKITMRFALECRVPMLDLDLVRFAESLPISYRLGIFNNKLIHKRFARNSLPSFVLSRKKKGFLSPTQSWFLNKNAIGDILLDNTSKFASFFDINAVRSTLVAHKNGYNRERHIFLLLCLYYWIAEFT